MCRVIRDLQQLDGIGKGLARRLAHAGFDSTAKVAAASEDEMRAIKGMASLPVAGIMAQARQLAAASLAEREAKIASLQQELAAFRAQVHSLAASAQERFAGELETKTGQKFSKSIAKMNASLEEVAGRMARRPRRAARVLSKAVSRLAGSQDADLPELRRSFKKARNQIKRILV